MRFRKLRIAWSVGWGLAAVLLILLWVRSYWWFDDFGGHTRSRNLGLESEQGQLRFTAKAFPPLSVPQERPWDWSSAPALPGWTDLDSWFPPNSKTIALRHVFSVKFSSGYFVVWLPNWSVAVSVFAIAVCPWIPRFNLRTLLIATTLVAVLLVLIVWLR